MVKNSPAIQETTVRALSWEDTLEESIATHSSIFAWRIRIDGGIWGATIHGGHKELNTTELTYLTLPYCGKKYPEEPIAQGLLR